MVAASVEGVQEDNPFALVQMPALWRSDQNRQRPTAGAMSGKGG